MKYRLLFILLVSAFCCFADEFTVDRNIVERVDTTAVSSLDSELIVDDAIVLDIDNPENEGVNPLAQADQNETKSNAINFNYKETKYWGRYTALRTAGWICFGVGTGFCLGGYALLFSAMLNNNKWADVAGVTGGIMFFSSPVLVAASIPLIACAYYNRYKAKHLKLDVGLTHIPSDRLTPHKISTPALSLALNF